MIIVVHNGYAHRMLTDGTMQSQKVEKDNEPMTGLWIGSIRIGSAWASKAPEEMGLTQTDANCLANYINQLSIVLPEKTEEFPHAEPVPPYQGEEVRVR